MTITCTTRVNGKILLIPNGLDVIVCNPSKSVRMKAKQRFYFFQTLMSAGLEVVEAITVVSTVSVRIYLDLIVVPVRGDSGRWTTLPVQVGDLNALVKQKGKLCILEF